MTLQGPSDLLRNQDDAAGRTAPVHEPVVTECAVHPPTPARPCLLDKVGRASAQQYEARKSKEQLPQQPAQSKTEPRRIPRLRAVVESQAFKNILVDEMDMMLSRAATLIQANWRGYRLRQKLISQMLAAKAIQEAWRRFNTRRLLRSSKVTVKRVSREEGDIPYHPPQQVRFQPPEDKPPQVQPVMMSKETQFPSSDSLVTCIPQLGLLQHPAAQGMAGPRVQAPHGPGAHGVAFLPHQTMAMRLPSPGSLDPKCQPCLLTKTVRSSCLIRHLEGDAVKTKHVTTRATRAGAPEPPPSGRYGQTVPGTFKAQIQAHVEADVHKTPPQAFPASTPSKTPPKTSPLVSITRTQAQVSPIPTVTKTPPQTGPGPMMTVMKTLAQTGPSPTVTRTQAQMRQTPSLTNAPLQSRLVATMAKIPPQVCLLASVMRPPCPARPGATTARPPPQTCPVSAMTKPSPQIRLVTAPTKNQTPTCQAAAVTKTPSQVCPGASIMKPPPQTRLAAMITKTPAQIRSVAAVLRTLCLVPPVVGNLRTPPQTAAGSPGIPSAGSTVHLNAQKGKVMVNVRQTAGAKDSSHSYLAEGKVRSVPQPHLEAGAPKPLARGPLEPEKVRTCLQRQVKKETVSKTNMTMEMTQPLPWTKVAEDRNKSPPQAQQRIELIKVQSQVYVPVEAAAAPPRAQMTAPLTKTLGQARPSPRQAKALPQEQLTTPLTKTVTQLPPATEQAKALSPPAHLATCPPTAMPQPHLATCLTKTTSQVRLTSEQTKVLSQGHLSTTLAKTLPQPPLAAPLMTVSPLHSAAKQPKVGPPAHLAPPSPKTPSQVYPPSRLTKTPSLAHLVTCLTKAQSQVHLSSGTVKIQSQAQLPVGLTKTQSQAQLVSQTKSFYTAHQSTDLNSKTQSQPLLTGPRASVPSCQHLGAMSFLSRPKSEDRPAQLQPQGHVQSKTTHGPCPVASEAQGMLVPLMTSTGHPTCNIEPWGDSGTARAQPPVASQAVPCQEAAASQIASLCAELAAVLGSQEDIRALLAKALSQGEVRAALNQALSKDVLGTTVTKAMPQGMLGMALVKALSWGELGITLSRALSRGELRSELTKVMQGKLAEVLSKALTDEERAALGQALCQGELGAVLSQSLSQAALRTGAILPKASSKTVGSGMSLLPASVEVDCRGNASAAWGSAVGPGRPQPSKGPVDAGLASGVPSVAVRPMDHAVAPQNMWETARGPVPWDTLGSVAAVSPRQPGELTVSVQTMEKILVRAAVVIQAFARGYLVRSTIRVWHQCATVIQASWRGFCVRRNLARLYRATTIIQAAWRGYCTRRDCAQQMLLPAVWLELGSKVRAAPDPRCFPGSEARLGSDHRCFQSCQPHICSLCQSLSPGLGNPPSVVMLVGSSPRTCHMCGHTLPTRVVHGMGRSISSQGGLLWACSSPKASQGLCRSPGQNRAAMAIQSAWRGFKTRRQLRQQQSAAKMVQSNWRGHYTRSCLTTDMLLGSGAPRDCSRDPSRHSTHSTRSARWPGV
ncbi:LOW QUALITY PROTEIN: IQ domain-containing protein N [Urocitellus parryii]